MHCRHVAVLAGDEERAHDSEGRPADVDLSVARLHSALKRRHDVCSTLRIRGGGHDAQFWASSVVDVVGLMESSPTSSAALPHLRGRS
jgi:hypothetical protein